MHSFKALGKQFSALFFSLINYMIFFALNIFFKELFCHNGHYSEGFYLFIFP